MESTFDVDLYDGTHQVDLYTNLSPLAIERQREVYRFILNMRSNSNTIHKMFEWTFEPIDHQTNEQTNHWTDIRNTRRLAIRAHSSSVPYDLTIVGRVYSQFRLMAVLYISAISIVFAPLNSIIRPSEKKNSEQQEESNVIVLLCVRYLQKWFSWAHTHTHTHFHRTFHVHRF